MDVQFASGSGYTYNKLQDYVPPSWARDMKYQPSAYVQLAVRPTPIHRWSLPGVPSGFQVSVKRDDMTGSVLSGNKVRKLEFLLADAFQNGCDSVVACGEAQSNSCRAAAIAAKQLGLQAHIILYYDLEEKVDPEAVTCEGNLLLDRCTGAKIVVLDHPLPSEQDVTGQLMLKVEEYAQHLESKGSVAYCIPLGGSNQVGLWGYIEAFRELQDQGVLENFDDIVVAVSSGGTACGLAIGNYLTGSKLKIHAVCTSESVDFFHGYIDNQLELNLLKLTKNSERKPLHSEDIVDIIDGYIGKGHGLITSEEQAQLLEIFTTTGVSVDPVYTLKGVRGMLSELQNNPGRFAGKRILYVHTGGIFGLYDGRIDQLLKQTPATNQVYSFEDIVNKKNDY